VIVHPVFLFFALSIALADRVMPAAQPGSPVV
jgi:hypothetical protein